MNFRTVIFILILLLPALVLAQSKDIGFTDNIAAQEKTLQLQKFNFQENPNYGWFDVIYNRMKWNIDQDLIIYRVKLFPTFKAKSTIFQK